MSANPAHAGTQAGTAQRQSAGAPARRQRMSVRTLYRRWLHPPAPETPAIIGRMHVETAGWDIACRYQQDWTDLAERCQSAHPFMSPAFALTAAQHFANGDRPLFLFVWNGQESTGSRLAGVFALDGRTGAKTRIVRLWHTPMDALAAPLIDPGCAAAVLDAVYDWARTSCPRAEAILYREIQADSAGTLRVEQHALDTGLVMQRFGTYSRANLALNGRVPQAMSTHLSRKKRKELARQYRRLNDKGALEYRIYNSCAEVRAAIEQFLALEASGWKGERATALLADPSMATFARTMTRRLAAEGKCEIHALELDGKPVSMALLLRAGDRMWFWKTAFDQAHAPQSPGVQLTLAMSRELATRDSLSGIDSCAIANHSMIDALWPGRVRITDLLISLRPGERQAFRRLARAEARQRKLRAIVKSIYLRLRDF